MNKLIIASFLLLAFNISLLAQVGINKITKAKKDVYLQKIDPNNFDDGLFNEALLKAINNELILLNEREFKEHSILSKAADEYAEFMVSINQAKTELGGKKQSLKARIEKNGGSSQKTIEIVIRENIREGKDTLNFAQLASNVVFKWFNAPKTADVIKDYKYIFYGVGSKLDADQKRVYVSLILGNNNLNNNGVQDISSFKQPITTKLKFKPYDSKICRQVDRFKNINELQNDLKVENGQIILETDRWRDYTRLLKEKTSSIAVDIVYREQYPCKGENIVDNRLATKGFVTKPLNLQKLLKVNQIEGREAKNNFKGELSNMPAIQGKYELNLVIVQEKHLCASVMKTYVEVGEMKNISEINAIADTLMTFSSMGYVPIPDTVDLQFRIPFEQGKSEYKSEDVQPFLDALNELEYNILSLKIIAFSSIEGEEAKNEQLREKRAESIVSAIEQIKEKSFEADIKTSNSWEMFYSDIEGTEFDTLKHLSKEDIQAKLEDINYYKNIEPILSRHRFALIEMRVVYDIDSDKKEQDFVLKKFTETVDSNDFVNALKIQKYIMKKAVRKNYANNVTQYMQLPQDSAKFAGMMMNQLWLEYSINNKDIDSLFWAEVLRLQNLDPNNDYIKYNRVYCEIKFNPIVNETQIGQMQRMIDDLAKSTLQKKDVDQLNLEYQMKILLSIGETFSPANERNFINDIVTRIKQIVEFKDNNPQSALDLAYLFIDMKDYNFAMQILEPFVTRTLVDENVLFTYISLCTNVQDKFQTEIYENALIKASKMNVERFCNLLRNEHFSFQFFENPNIKGLFCKTCFE